MTTGASVAGQEYLACRQCGRGYWPDVEADVRAEAAGSGLLRRLRFTSGPDLDPWRRCVFCASADLRQAAAPQLTPAVLGITRPDPASADGGDGDDGDDQPTEVAERGTRRASAISRLRRR